jgi:hypothetical protein
VFSRDVHHDEHPRNTKERAVELGLNRYVDIAFLNPLSPPNVKPTNPGGSHPAMTKHHCLRKKHYQIILVFI